MVMTLERTGTEETLSRDYKTNNRFFLSVYKTCRNPADKTSEPCISPPLCAEQSLWYIIYDAWAWRSDLSLALIDQQKAALQRKLEASEQATARTSPNKNNSRCTRF